MRHATEKVASAWRGRHAAVTSAMPRSCGLGRRRDVFDRALPAAFGDVEHEALGRPVLDLVVDVRASFLASGEIAAARGFDLLVDLVDAVDPHAEVDQALIALVETRHRLLAEVEQGD